MKFIYLKKAIKLIVRYCRLSFIIILSLRILLGIFPLGTLLITNSLVNEASSLIQNKHSDYTTILLLLIFQFGLSILNSFLNHMNSLLENQIEFRLDYKVGKKIASKSMTVPLSYFEIPDFYNHHDRINKGSYGNRILTPIKCILDIIQSLISFMSYIGFLLSVHWAFLFILLLSAIPTFLTKSKFGSKKFFLMRFQTPTAREALYTKSLLNNKQAAKEIRLFGIGDFLLTRWSNLFKINNNQMLRLIRKEKISLIGLDAISSLVYSGAAGLLVYLLGSNQLNIGQFVTVIQAIQGSQGLINNISSNLARVYENQLYIQDVFKFLEYQNLHIVNPDGKESFPDPLKEGISIKDLSFKYPESQKEVLSNINLHIHPGEKIAIVGENGSGKTTLVKCIMGLYLANMGSIFFDDKDIKNIDSKKLRKNITAIFQDFVKYSYSVKDNVTFGNIDCYNNVSKLKEVGIKSGIHDFVKKLPLGYETRLGKVLADGEDLSGGQWQKIALSRALFRDSQIIILDEPTAALDPKTEFEVYNYFNQLTLDKIAIYISHRMASAKMADRIVVMKEGKIIEIGSHHELMLQHSEYYRMYHMQAQWYI